MRTNKVTQDSTEKNNHNNVQWSEKSCLEHENYDICSK